MVSLLAKLPGVGEKTAHRYVLHLLTQAPALAGELGAALAALPADFAPCDLCGNVAERAPTQGDASSAEVRCDICRDHKRDATTLCVVARVTDLLAFERPQAYRGRYFVLAGLLSPLEGIGPEKLPIGRLKTRVLEDQVREVILATPATVDGEATALFLQRELTPFAVSQSLRISRIASGIPHGGDLEFIDPVTLGRALEGRKAL